MRYLRGELGRPFTSLKGAVFQMYYEASGKALHGRNTGAFCFVRERNNHTISILWVLRLWENIVGKYHILDFGSFSSVSLAFHSLSNSSSHGTLALRCCSCTGTLTL